MGTRSGDIDAALVDYIAAKEGCRCAQAEALLNKQAGCSASPGSPTTCATCSPRRTSTMIGGHAGYRHSSATARAVHRQLPAAMGGRRGGVRGRIGENSPEIRARVWRGCSGQAARGRGGERRIGGRGEGASRRRVRTGCVGCVPTDEELHIARDSYVWWRGWSRPRRRSGSRCPCHRLMRSPVPARCASPACCSRRAFPRRRASSDAGAQGASRATALPAAQRAEVAARPWESYHGGHAERAMRAGAAARPVRQRAARFLQGRDELGEEEPEMIAVYCATYTE
jgi:hypothetical protein